MTCRCSCSILSNNGSEPHELFALLCIIGWILVEFAPGRWVWPNALCNLSSLNRGRVWTLLTSNLVHANPVHMLNNLLQVLHIGPVIHHALGCERAVALLVSAMLASSSASVLWHGVVKGRRDAGSIGASGVGMALVAANAALFRTWLSECMVPSSLPRKCPSCTLSSTRYRAPAADVDSLHTSAARQPDGCRAEVASLVLDVMC